MNETLVEDRPPERDRLAPGAAAPPRSDSVDMPATGSARPRVWPVVLATAGVAALTRLATIGHFVNLDETLWMARSESFSDALTGLDPGGMSAIAPLSGTMPGIPTVWLGSLGRLLWGLGGVFGIIDTSRGFRASMSGVATAQATVAVATALLIGLLAWLVSHWMSRRVGLVTGVVLATEPFWVSLGAILHTDELVALFGLAGLVALGWASGLPPGVTPPRHPGRWFVTSAALLVLAPLTKVSGIAFGPPAIAMLVWAFARDVRTRDATLSVWGAARPLLRRVAWMCLAAAVVVVVTYPALVFGFGEQWDALVHQVRTVGKDRHVFFKGAYITRPDIGFYPITLAYVSSAWFLVLAPVGVVVALVRRSTRLFAVTALAWAVVPAASLLRSGLVYTRYGLVVLGPLTLAAAASLQPAQGRSLRRWWADRVNPAVVGAVVVVSAIAVTTAPWSGLTFNPIMSAYREPILVLRVGWGEEAAAALPVIQRDARARGLECREVAVSGIGRGPFAGSCQPVVADQADADYMVVGAPRRQQFAWTLKSLPDDFELLEVVHIRGQRVAEVWRARDPTR